MLAVQQMAAKATEVAPTCSPSCGPRFHCQSGRCQPGPPLHVTYTCMQCLLNYNSAVRMCDTGTPEGSSGPTWLTPHSQKMLPEV